MAIVKTYITDGSLINALYEELARIAPYRDVPLETRLENALQYFIDLSNAVAYDYQMGGYVNYGMLPDGKFRVDLDAFSIIFDGAFSSSGSRVTSINLRDSFGGLNIYEGVFNYAGLPLFSNSVGNGTLTSVGRIEPNGTDSSSVFLNATVSPELNVQGTIQGFVSAFVDASGNKVHDFTGGGNATFNNSSGSMDVVSGTFTSGSFSTSKFPSTVYEVIDSFTVENAYIPLSSTFNTLDILSGDDVATMAGTRGSMAYVSTGNDTVFGSLYSDTLHGEAGNDFLAGGGGDDLIYGGEGIDVAGFNGNLDEYAISVQPSTLMAYSTIQDLMAGRSGTDSVRHVERLHFTDVNLALDITGISAEAYRIYKAAFNRTPDLPGLGYWIHQMDLGENVVQVSAAFIASAEFESMYGPNPTNNEFVDLLYQNVLGRNPDAGGYAYWNAMLSNGLSRPETLAYFSESPENVANVAPLIANGIEYLPYDSVGYVPGVEYMPFME